MLAFKHKNGKSITRKEAVSKEEVGLKKKTPTWPEYVPRRFRGQGMTNLVVTGLGQDWEVEDQVGNQSSPPWV
ncbi:hypothetical protein A3D69_03375 [Candidatus Uhrbacteria bacterium RIFCSPHIGHO2_02_FULL_54_11]|nr:MAG: hypothetical protein A3D69_03375 [Candidatus Uhrbacteria bacterium RIFCSPHIGHO2_02_FULL_54_11]